jgi:hypothetical protein
MNNEHEGRSQRDCIDMCHGANSRGEDGICASKGRGD